MERFYSLLEELISRLGNYANPTPVEDLFKFESYL